VEKVAMARASVPRREEGGRREGKRQEFTPAENNVLNGKPAAGEEPSSSRGRRKKEMKAGQKQPVLLQRNNHAQAIRTSRASNELQPAVAQPRCQRQQKRRARHKSSISRPDIPPIAKARPAGAASACPARASNAGHGSAQRSPPAVVACRRARSVSRRRQRQAAARDVQRKVHACAERAHARQRHTGARQHARERQIGPMKQRRRAQKASGMSLPAVRFTR